MSDASQQLQPQQQQQPKIDWIKSAGNFALAFWGFATYLALLGGIAWLATTAGPNPTTIALLAVLGSTSFNILMFGAIEHCARD